MADLHYGDAGTNTFGQDPPLSECPGPIAIVGMGKCYDHNRELDFDPAGHRLSLARRCFQFLTAMGFA
jgi:hypothetical protein